MQRFIFRGIDLFIRLIWLGLSEYNFRNSGFRKRLMNKIDRS